MVLHLSCEVQNSGVERIIATIAWLGDGDKSQSMVLILLQNYFVPLLQMSHCTDIPHDSGSICSMAQTIP